MYSAGNLALIMGEGQDNCYQTFLSRKCLGGLSK